MEPLTKNKIIIWDIYLQLDKDGKGSISLYDYFGIFESHGIKVKHYFLPNKHFEGSCELLSLNLILMLTSC